jgi:DNA replication protein DnaC
MTGGPCVDRGVRIKMDSALNLGYDEWPNFLGNRPMVEALLSRLRHYCHTVRIDGPSLCELQG